MSVTAAMAVSVVARTQQFDAAMDKSGAKVATFAGRVRLVSKGLSLLRGAGVFAGITLAARAAIRTLDEYNKSINEVLEGTKTWEEMVQGLHKSIPIIGSVASGFETVAQAIANVSMSGDIKRTAEMTEQLKGQAEMALESIQNQHKWEEKLAKRRDEIAERKAKRHANELNLQDALAEGQQKINDVIAKEEQARERVLRTAQIELQVEQRRRDAAIEAARAEQMRSAAQSIKELVKSPKQRFKEEAAEAVRLFRAGLISKAERDAFIAESRRTAVSAMTKDMMSETATRTAAQITDPRFRAWGRIAGPKVLEQEVKDKQLRETNDLLTKIADSIKLGPLAVTAP